MPVSSFYFFNHRLHRFSQNTFSRVYPILCNLVVFYLSIPEKKREKKENFKVLVLLLSFAYRLCTFLIAIAPSPNSDSRANKKLSGVIAGTSSGGGTTISAAKNVLSS